MSFAKRLQTVEERIAAACERAGRNRDDVTLIAVSKTKPVSAITEATTAGIRVFGENRVQELRDKYEALPDDTIAWHLIGTLQSNKVKYLPGIKTLSMIHSVDSEKLARELERQGEKHAHVFDVLLEVNMAREATKGGLAPEEVRSLAEAVAPLSHLRVRGLMTIAPFTEDAESNRPYFRGLRELMEEINASQILPEPMRALSMGMSGDYEVAIEEGATYVRVGTALFGER